MSLEGEDPLVEAAPSPKVEGVSCINHSRRAMCKASMYSRVRNWVVREWGGIPLRSKCSVVVLVGNARRGQRCTEIFKGVDEIL